MAIGQTSGMGAAKTEMFSKNTNSPARAGDEQMLRWLQEYVRRRDDAKATGRRGDSFPLSDLKARIAAHHSTLVESIARRFLASGEPFEDLVQEGFLGLLSALENYDTSKNVKFSTYATHFIAGAVRHCLRDRGKIIKEPAWLHELHGKISRTKDSLTQTLGRPPHAGEIAQVLNLTEEAVEEVLSGRQVFQVAAFDTSSGDGDSEFGMTGLVDPEKIRSDKHVTLHLPIEDRIVLEESALKLKTLEQKVLYEFFYKDHNQTEIAKQMGISCNYVSHILKNSTKKLRRIMGEADVMDRGSARESSIVDRATGLYTAAHILARVEEEISRAARFGGKTALLVVVIDGLPTIAGNRRDEVWAACGEAVRKSIRRCDVAGRYESDSVLILLPNTDARVSIVAERLSKIVSSTGEALEGRLSVRFGFATSPDQGRTMNDLLVLARDEAALPTDESPVLRAA